MKNSKTSARRSGSAAPTPPSNSGAAAEPEPSAAAPDTTADSFLDDTLDEVFNNAASEGKGAAEEPERAQVASSAVAASYDPTVFQRPHPDDRGGADGCKPRKKDGGDGKPKTKDGKARDGKGALSLDRCGNCGMEGDLRKCKQCGAVAYCGEACQKVSAMAGWRAGVALRLGGSHASHAPRTALTRAQA